MTRSESPGITIEFIGCCKDPVSSLFVETRVTEDGADIYKTFQEVEKGTISGEEMVAYLKRKNVKTNADAEGPIQFLFIVRKVSRHCSDNIKASFPGVLSKNFVNAGLELPRGSFECSLPPEVQNNEGVMDEWKILQEKLKDLYQRCLETGMDQQAAELLLPMGTLNHRLMLFSFQSLQQYLDQNLCAMANWEQQEIAWQIFGLMKEKFPKLTKRIGIKCWDNRSLYCDEKRDHYHRCQWSKERPHQEDFMNLWAKTSSIRPSSSLM